MHDCIGAPLARLGAGSAWPAYERFPKLRIAVDLAELAYPSFVTVGPATLPVHLY